MVTQTKLDPESFTITAPESSLQNDPKAWQNALSTAKIQYSHQESQLLALELFETHLSNCYLQQNSALELITSFYADQTQALTRELFDLQKTRQTLQRKAAPQLLKYDTRRNQATTHRIQCEIAYQEINRLLLQKGFDFAAYKEELNNPIDAFDHQINNTVREYETINVHKDDGDDDHKHSDKKPRLK